jgi:MFS family permease
MMLAVLPMFITSIGGGGIALGIISGLGDSIASLFKVISGWWSDRIRKRKPFAFYGYVISCVAKFFFPFAWSWQVLAALRPLERLGKGLRDAPRDALLANSVPPEIRGKTFGLHSGFDTAGAFVGTLAALLLFYFYGFSYRAILLFAALVGFAALVPFLWIKEAAAEEPLIPSEVSKPSDGFSLKIKDLPAGFIEYILIVSLFALANFSYMFFVLRSRNCFLQVMPPKLATAVPILLYILFNAVYTVCAVPAGLLSDKIGRHTVLFAGYLVFAGSCLGFAFAGSVISFAVFFAVYGVAYSLIDSTQRAFASSFVDNKRRGTAFGVFHTAISISALPGGLIAGMLWNAGQRYLFIYGFILSLISAILIMAVKPAKNRHGQSAAARTT